MREIQFQEMAHGVEFIDPVISLLIQWVPLQSQIAFPGRPTKH